MKTGVKIVCDSLKNNELYHLLTKAKEIQQENSIELKLVENEDKTLALDPVTLNAIITGSISLLGILITGIFAVWKTNRANKASSIVLKSKDGTSITFPAGLSDEEIDNLIKRVKQLDSPKLIIKE